VTAAVDTALAAVPGREARRWSAWAGRSRPSRRWLWGRAYDAERIHHARVDYERGRKGDRRPARHDRRPAPSPARDAPGRADVNRRRRA